LYVNDKKVAETKIDQIIPGSFSLSESFDVGIDNGTPVSKNYGSKDHFAYSGVMDKVMITIRR